MSVLDLLIHRCRIERATVTMLNGVQQKSWNTFAADVRCLVQQKSGRFTNAAGREFLQDAIVFLPPDAVVRPNVTSDERDRIVITAPAESAGAIYLIEATGDTAGQGNHQTVRVSRHRGG